MAQLGNAFLTPNDRIQQGHDAAQWGLDLNLLLGLLSKAKQMQPPVGYDSAPDFGPQQAPGYWRVGFPVRMG